MKTTVLKSFLILALSLIAFNDQSYAQGSRESIEAYRVAFLTRELSLSSDEASKFWPVYNSYQQEITSLRQSRKSGSLSEIQFKEKELNVLKKYDAKFKTVLPAAKASKVYPAEEKFRAELLKKLQD